MRLRVHSSSGIECLDYRGDLSEKPRLRVFVRNEDEFVVVFARLVSKANTSIFYRHALHKRERKIPI